MFDIFKAVLADIEDEVSSANYATWFKGLSLVEIDDEAKVARIGAPSVFTIKQLESKFYDIILKAFQKRGVKIEQLEFSVKTSASEKDKAKIVQARNEEGIRHGGESGAQSFQSLSERLGKMKPREEFSTGLNSKYTLDSFVVGSNNELAAGVANLIIADPGGKYNPFFLYGGPGLGKTHLVQAIGNAILENHPEMKVLYVPTNHFYSEFINAVRNGKGGEFVKKYQSLDVLIIDDFQLIIGKERSQEEFFNIFNDLHQANKQIIVTSDRMPEQIKTLDLRLSSRLTMGGAYDIQFPGFEDRCAILKAKAEFLGCEIEDEAIEYLAEMVKTNIRDLEGEFQKLTLLASIRGMTPLAVIKDGYISGSASQRRRRANAEQVVKEVAKYYGLSVQEMTGKSRVSNIKTARQVAMFILSTELGMSTSKIAPEVGVKDHTTVMNGIKKIKKDQESDLQLKDQIEQIKENIFN